MPSFTLLQDLIAEVNHFTEKGLHPKVDALVCAFLNYLKEPRFQNPLTLSELRELFDAFYEDLNSLVFHIYTQSNTNKRQLLQKSHVFKSDPKTFDYLNAIANYSSSSIKLSKRSDPDALYQLRIFGFYKFITILRTIELAHLKLYSSSNSPDLTPLYEKVFRFDRRDIEIQNLLSEKIKILRQMNLPIQCFLESDNQSESMALDKALSSLETSDGTNLTEIKEAFTKLVQAQTPASKLDHIARIQKLIMKICASCHGNDYSKISNDVLLPAFIHIIVNHSPLELEDESFDIYLHFMFVKNFWKPLDLQKINTSRFTLTSSLYNYNPMDKRAVLPQNNQSRTLSNLLNLEDDATSKSEEVSTSQGIPEFSSDQELINLIQNQYLNSGELQFCLTNCEAILYFLSSTPITGIAPRGITIPPEVLESEMMNLSLNEIILKREDSPTTNDSKDLPKLLEEELGNTSRSRSSSLFTTISSAVSQSVNRSRSNSGVKLGQSMPNKESLPFATDFENSFKQYQGANETYGLNRVRNIFEKIGSVSHLQAKPIENEDDGSHDTIETLERTPESTRAKRSHSLFDRLSPNQNRNRSGSLENLWNAQGTSLRRATLSNKFSTGMTELMTKISTAANTATGSSVNVANPENTHNSSSSFHSIEDPFEDNTFAEREQLGPRSSSLQTMEKWFCSIPENSTVDGTSCQKSNTSISSNRLTPSGSNYNEGSLFSAPFAELTKYHFTDFDSMTINDLKTLKVYYDQLCSEFLSGKSVSKTSKESLSEDAKEVASNTSSEVQMPKEK
ncbi:hypothetical protein JCM33374_g4120 [Metschnikowia sp. JCM 33374]|nr:hypothetical protein JCM33374_g4120 [Metschnikowia sp. JCM 33374]